MWILDRLLLYAVVLELNKCCLLLKRLIAQPSLLDGTCNNIYLNPIQRTIHIKSRELSKLMIIHYS